MLFSWTILSPTAFPDHPPATAYVPQTMEVQEGSRIPKEPEGSKILDTDEHHGTSISRWREITGFFSDDYGSYPAFITHKFLEGA
jgi:hypothetical protein